MRAQTVTGQLRLGPLVEPRPVRWLLVGGAGALLLAFVAVPLVAVFATAFGEGVGRYLQEILEPEAQSALRLTSITALLVVPANTIFGVAAAWCIARLRFRGKRLLVGSLDLPLSVSPVVAGLAFVLLLGSQSFLGRWLLEHGVRVIFALPAIVLATAFVTVPYVAREVLAVLEVQGSEQEAAAMTLGASGWQTFLRITLPKIRWGLLYGVALCAARAMGEFGAVSVVSGHVRGETVTLPLHAQILYDQYDSVGAFAAASLLTAPALITLVTKKLVEWRSRPA